MLVLLGSIAYGTAGQALAGRWRPWAFVPVVNALVVSALVTRHLEDPRPARRVLVDVAALALFALRARVDPFLGVLPALVAADLMTSAQRLVHQLAGPAPDAPPAP